MKFFSTILLTALILLGISSCVKKETYSVIPAITFKNLILYSPPSDSLLVQINFTDGDGDIGYTASDTGAAYNCYLELLVDTAGNGKFVAETTSNPLPKVTTGDTLVYAYHIPYITPDGSNKALKGEIQIAFSKSVWYTPLKPILQGKQLKFQVWIIDRAGHVSNRILTSSILFPSS